MWGRFAAIPKEPTLLEFSRLHLLLPARVRGRLLRGHYWVGGDQLDVDYVPGTAMIVRREAINAAGLLSEQIAMYGEDIEWCWRINRAGWRVGVFSQLRFQHIGGTSANRTWGAVASRQRMVRGIYEACREMRGTLYARLLLAVMALALAAESWHPLRPSAHKQNSRALSRAYFNAMLDR